jgi:threonine dehydrogenase-like Zn-dependent dehydrogenase
VAIEAMCHPIPDQMSFDEGVMLEPLCVGLHATRRAELKLGERVAILGVGTIGMMTFLCVRCCGPGWMAVSDPSGFKRETALRLGADLAVNPAQADPVQEIVKATDGLGADVVFVAVALDPVLQQALLACRRMGRLVIIASFFTGGALGARHLQVRERHAIGTSMYTADDYRLAIHLWERGHFPELSSLIAERITLEQAPATIAALAYSEQSDTIKVIIRFD